MTPPSTHGALRLVPAGPAVVDAVAARFGERREFFDDGTIADTRWNGWRLNARECALQLGEIDGHPSYTVELLRCDQSAAVLDILVHVSARRWPDLEPAAATAGLLAAVDDVLHLQTSLCGWGVHLTMTELQIRDRIACFAQQFHEGEQP